MTDPISTATDPMRALLGIPPLPGTSPAAPATFRESAGATVDSESDEGWRRLSGDASRDLEPMTQERMQRLAAYQWRANLLANRLIEVPLAYLLSQGVKWRIDDEAAQEALDTHWRDGLNAWDIKLPKRARELALFGEQCYPVFVSNIGGPVRLGYLDPAAIETVVMDPENREQPIGVITKKDQQGNARKYRVIVNVPETAFADRTRKIRDTFTTGDCFFFRINELCNASRGVSDLVAQIDWLDAYDQFLFGEVDRSTAARAFIWDVKVTGATPDEIKAKAKTIAPPRSNSVRVHNENEEWTAVSPTLNAFDAGESAKLIRNHMLGGATMPEHWYGGAGDVNRATGTSMAEPTEKSLDMRQRQLGHMLEYIGQFVVRAHWGNLDRELSKPQAKLLASLRVEWPEMTAKDTTKYASALQQVVAAVLQLVADGFLTDETALRMVATMADRLGIEIDVEEELKAAREQAANRMQDHTPPTDDGETPPAAAPGSNDA